MRQSIDGYTPEIRGNLFSGVFCYVRVNKNQRILTEMNRHCFIYFMEQ